MRTGNILLFGLVVSTSLPAIVGAQPPEEHAKEHDMFSHFIGVWKAAGEVKPTKIAPAGGKFTVQETTRSALKGSYILSREHSQPDDKKSLWLITLDKPRNTCLFWMFDSNGLLGGKWELTWNNATKTATGRAADTPPGWTSQSSHRFPDRNTNQVHFWMKDEKGTLLFEVLGEKKRLPELAGQAMDEEWAKGSLDPAASPEHKVLDQFVGTWDAVTISRPAEWTPKEIQMKSLVVRQSILNGRFILDNSVHANGEESLALFGFDPSKREYRGWWFNSEGLRNTSRGSWDPSNRTFSFVTDSEDGKISTATIRLFNPDHHEWLLKVTDKTGKVFYDTTITVTRRMAGDKPRERPEP